MKTTLLVVGRTVEQHFITAINDYIQRTRRYLSFEMEVIPELKNTKSLSFEVQKEKEGELILKALQPGDVVVLLDEGGKEMRYRVRRLYEAQDEHRKQTACFYYRRTVWFLPQSL